MGFTGLTDQHENLDDPNSEVVTVLLCDGEFECSWKLFDWKSADTRMRDAIKDAYLRGKRDQMRETAQTLRQIFGIKS